MTDREELERYERLLNDWQFTDRPAGSKETPPSPRPPRESLGRERRAQAETTPAPRPQAAAAVKAAPARTPPAGGALHEPGTILLIDESALAIYKRAVPEKEYHLVCTLLPKGAVRTEGLALDAYEVDELGVIPSPLFEKLQSDLNWDRDLIVFHCFRFEDAQRVPHNPGQPAPTTRETARPENVSHAAAAHHAPAPPKADPNQLLRGKRLRVKFGDKAWDAVYWGHDEQGHVVAHHTNNQWALMHLDLDRFKDGLEIDPHPDAALVEDIAQSFQKQ